MNLFLDKDDETKLLIVRLLSNTMGDWVTGTEIADNAIIGQKKVITLINSINDDFGNVYFEKDFSIISCSGKGYCMKNSPKNFKKLEIYYFNHSIAFLFIKKLLFDQKKTTIEFCIENYISLATLNRKLKRILPILKLYDLKLNVSKGQLTGKEVRIRQFYYELLRYIYGIYEWPIENIEKKSLERLIEQLNLETKSDFNVTEKNIMEVYLAISIIRIRQKHYVDSDFLTYSWLANHPLYRAIHHFVSSRFKQVEDVFLNLESEYLVFLFITSLRIDRCDNEVEKEIAFFKDNNVREYMLVKKIQNKLTEYYDREKQLKSNELTYILTRRVLLIKNFGYMSNTEEMEKYLLRQQINYPIFYSFIKKTVFRQMDGDLNFYQMQQLLTEIIPMLKVKISVVEYENPIKIGLLYEMGTSQQYIIQSKIIEKINKKVVFETNEENFKNMDIIVADEKNFRSIKEHADLNIPIISFEGMFNDNFIKKLSRTIENI